MKKLSYSALEEILYPGYLLREAPEKILQFGEGNFLRAFVDYFVDIANERNGFNGKIVAVQPIEKGLSRAINDQQGLYTLYLRGMNKGAPEIEKRVISAVSRCLDPYTDFDGFLACAANPELRFIVSNTTEAGIVYRKEDQFADRPQSSFPGKLTRFLYERYRLYGTQKGKGFIILSCELIDQNGQQLKKAVQQMIANWGLEPGFMRWAETENIFCSSLVDRIVTGYPLAEAEEMNRQNGYLDSLLDTAEPFGLWAIEGDNALKEELPFVGIGLPVLVVKDQTPYKKRKVRILNGAYSALALPAYLCGYDTVRGSMACETLRKYRDQLIYQEIIPTIDLPRKELETFAASVIERYNNPYIASSLLSISLNAVSKWKTRILPTIRAYYFQNGVLPKSLVFSMAGLLRFFACGHMEKSKWIGMRGNEPYEIRDDPEVLRFFAEHDCQHVENLVFDCLARTDFWGEDLNQLADFSSMVIDAMHNIAEQGMEQALAKFLP